VRHAQAGKLPNRHRYHLTDEGRQLTTALNAMLGASIEKLLDMVA
jgi:DNA-binding HxlR family transcriptional regulator